MSTPANPVTEQAVPEGAVCIVGIPTFGSSFAECARRARFMVIPKYELEPKPMCGIHARARERVYLNEKHRREMQADRIRAQADNLARFLTEQLGVQFTANGNAEIVLEIEDARRIYGAGVKLYEPETGAQWRIDWRGH